MAADALKQLRWEGARACEVPVAERTLHDAGFTRIEQTLEFVPVVGADGTPDVATVRAAHVRVEGEVYERMGSRCLLAPGDPDKNHLLLQAARRFYRDWYEAGLSPVRGQDPGKIRSTAVYGGLLVGPDNLIGAERQANGFRAYRDALAALDKGERVAVEAIVLHDKLAVWVGSKISGLVDKGGSKAVGMYALRGGLEKLAIHYGLMTEPECDPMEDVMAGLLADIDAREVAAA